MKYIKKPIHECLKCGYEWVGRKDSKPKVCPKCCNPNWWKLSKKQIQDLGMNKFLR